MERNSRGWRRGKEHFIVPLLHSVFSDLEKKPNILTHVNLMKGVRLGK